jgi:hypothetical protein
MIKWWNRLNGDLLQSYEIEELINDLFKIEIPEYAEAIYIAFSAIMRKLTDAGHDTSSSDLVPANARTAWLISRQARELALERHGKQDIESSFRRLFGEQFPLVCS